MEKRIPKRRFKEFIGTGEWKEKKLGELGKTFNGLSGKSKKDFGHGKAEFVTYLNVFNNTISNIYETDNVEIDDRQNQVEYGDIFFTTSSETPEEVGMSSVWMDNRPNVYLNSFCFGYRLSKPMNIYYIAYLLRSPSIRKEFQLLAQGISRYNISKIKAMDINISIPSLAEQEKIGHFFQKLDRLIDINKQKLGKLKASKSAYLEEMFPGEGEDRPKRRFKGFTEKWEEKKLGEVGVFNPKENLPLNFKYIDLESVSGIKIIDYRKEKKETAPSRAQRLARKGDLFYQMVRPYQKNNYLFNKSLNDYVFSTGYAQIRPYGDGYFLLSLVQNDLFVKLVLDRCTGTGYPAINSNDLAEINILIPSLAEQEKVGHFFKKLDDQIGLQEEKLEKLEKMKKAYLAEMFV